MAAAALITKREHPLLRGQEPEIVLKALSFCSFKDVAVFNRASRSARNLGNAHIEQTLKTLFPTHHAALIADARNKRIPLGDLADRCALMQGTLSGVATPEELEELAKNPDLIGPKRFPFEAALKKTKEHALAQFYQHKGETPHAAYKAQQQARYDRLIAQNARNQLRAEAALDPHLVGFATEADDPRREPKSGLAIALVQENDDWSRRYLHSLSLMHGAWEAQALVNKSCGDFDRTEHLTLNDLETAQKLMDLKNEADRIENNLAEDDFLPDLNQELDILLDLMENNPPFGQFPDGAPLDEQPTPPEAQERGFE